MTRLLAVRLSALGDVIHTIPAVVALRDAMPETEIAWAVEAPYRELVEIVARVEAVPVSLRKWPREPMRRRGEIASFWRAIRRSDVAVDFQGLIKSAAIVRLSGASRRVGFDRDALREKQAAWFTNAHVAVDQNRHVIDWNLQLARAIAPAAAQPRLDFSPFASGRPELEDLRGAVVLLPGAGRPSKQWAPDRFREVVRRIGPAAVAVWGPGEEELAQATGARLAPRTNLRELAWVLHHASAVIGGDTGPLHLADALGTPVVGLYGPTNPRRNGPYSQLDHCISTFGGASSMDAIGVSEVMSMLEKVRR